MNIPHVTFPTDSGGRGLVQILSMWMLALSLLSGCSSTTPTSPTSEPAPPPAATPAEPTAPAPAREPSTDTATLALLNQSERAADSGEIEAAMAYTERALRIEPQRADLWTRLAALQLQHGDPAIAIQYATKALTLAKHRADWRRDAWLVIADAREAQGDMARAREIRDQWQSAKG